jgi:hypothetical protein
MPLVERSPCRIVGRAHLSAVAWLALGASTLWGIPCLAAGWATYQVDDSMSQTQAPSAALRWRNPLPSRNTLDQLEATMQVRVVLNVSPWVGKQARVYMVMPSLAQSSLAVQWTTTGLLAPGRLSGGQRQLVFQGVVPGARIEDTLRVTVLADARDAATPARVNFTFEIEVPSP